VVGGEFLGGGLVGAIGSWRVLRDSRKDRWTVMLLGSCKETGLEPRSIQSSCLSPYLWKSREGKLGPSQTNPMYYKGRLF
jgi:hypothetical protein